MFTTVMLIYKLSMSYTPFVPYLCLLFRLRLIQICETSICKSFHAQLLWAVSKCLFNLHTRGSALTMTKLQLQASFVTDTDEPALHTLATTNISLRFSASMLQLEV